MGKRRESAGRCLESESVGSLGQEERREGLQIGARCPDEHIYHDRYCPFKSVLPNLAPNFL